VQNPLIHLDIAIVPKDLVMDQDPQCAGCCATRQRGGSLPQFCCSSCA